MKLETNTREIFGLVDDVLDTLERNERQPVTKKKRLPTALPKMQVKRSRHVPELENVDAGNVVYVPESVLKTLASTLNIETKILNKMLLQKLMPLLLSYQTATTYTRAAIKEGLDVDVDFDAGLQDLVQHIGYISVAMHFIRRSNLPLSIKQRFMRKFSDLIAERAVTAMVEENKADNKRTLMQELQAVVYSRQQNKTEVKTNKDREQSNTKPDENLPVRAVKKTRR